MIAHLNLFIEKQRQLVTKLASLKGTLIEKKKETKVGFSKWDLLRLAKFWHTARSMWHPVRVELTRNYLLAQPLHHTMNPLQ